MNGDEKTYTADKYNILFPEVLRCEPPLGYAVNIRVVKLDDNPQGLDCSECRNSKGERASFLKDGEVWLMTSAMFKLAQAAGIEFIEERLLDNGQDHRLVEIEVIASRLSFDGHRIIQPAAKRIDLRKADPKPTELRFIAEKARTGARMRAITQMIGLPRKVWRAMLAKPFAVPCLVPAIEQLASHPEVGGQVTLMLAARVLGSEQSLYGAIAAARGGLTVGGFLPPHAPEPKMLNPASYTPPTGTDYDAETGEVIETPAPQSGPSAPAPQPAPAAPPSDPADDAQRAAFTEWAKGRWPNPPDFYTFAATVLGHRPKDIRFLSNEDRAKIRAAADREDVPF